MRAHEFIKEQELKITRVSGNKAFAGDGIEIDLDKVEIGKDNNKTTIKPKTNGTGRAPIRPGQTVTLATEDDLSEGINDPNIFKAVFLAGGPGSGKSFVAKKLLSNLGLRPINSDDVYEYMLKKAGLEPDSKTIFSPQGQEIRAKAKEITGRRQDIYLDGRLGLIIDGTGKDVQRTAKVKDALQNLGYDAMMVFVNTDLDIAQKRNMARARKLDPEQVENMWRQVQSNLMKFQQVFGAGNFHIVDNSGGLEDPDRAENFANVEKQIRKFLANKPSLPAAQAWIKDQTQKNAR